MGLSARCRATRGRRTTDGEAHLEGDRLTFRGGFRITVPFDSITAVRAQTGTLILECPDGRLALRIGAGAEKWAEKIRNPRSRVDKLGIKPAPRSRYWGSRIQSSRRTCGTGRRTSRAGCGRIPRVYS